METRSNQRFQTAVEYGLHIKPPNSSFAASMLRTLMPESSFAKFALQTKAHLIRVIKKDYT